MIPIMNAIEHMVKTMPRTDLTAYKFVVPKQEYEKFCNEILFDMIKGKSFGIAFADKFGIPDPMLSIGLSDNFCIQHIQNMEYVSPT